MSNVPSNDDNSPNTTRLSSVVISSKAQVDKLADELADSYLEYLLIDTGEQQKRYTDSLEECLAHLEEASAVFDQYCGHNGGQAVAEVVDKVCSKAGSLDHLYQRVDAVEQYIFETSRLLDQLESVVKDLEARRPSRNKIRQLMDLLPRLTIGSSLGGMVEEPERSIVELLETVATIEGSFDAAASNLNLRLHGDTTGAPDRHKGESMKMLDGDTAEQVDSSWQELL